ncbi:MAG: flagellar assembly protein FliW [Rhodocyclaceae bacterium]|nr:flagellar assembly protein FliW [Rhodocyclaceae bacterium]MCP5234045.1 flagellar assembly protein FliW [Zoogloeaceae bacterium]MCB1911769.1 flagellar assembly protein FliW [Rhodocyclaceae bacterium]MCP5240417.1 flagellar assembly protein FliW [Zoogloeaceae bacterium]MCP5253474.1 flagellar assembly protein FliW [Zoogloeaceae bacterium]
MKIESPVFGTLEVSDDRIIEFPAGLPGFDDCHRFTMIHEEGAAGQVVQLQSLDQPEVVLSIAGPETLGISYDFTLSDAEVDTLRLTRPEDVVVAVVIRRAGDEGKGPSEAGLRANFIAPLVINTASRIGMQKIFSKLGCDITLRA